MVRESLALNDLVGINGNVGKDFIQVVSKLMSLGAVWKDW